MISRALVFQLGKKYFIFIVAIELRSGECYPRTLVSLKLHRIPLNELTRVLEPAITKGSTPGCTEEYSHVYTHVLALVELG